MKNNKAEKAIQVTQPYLPPLKEYNSYLDKIWKNKILTNDGPLHQQLEKKLAEYLGVKYVSLFANGTLALMVALKSLDLKGQVITTPFSFVATAHALWWNNLTPVFVDIEPNFFNLNPEKIESAITKKTTAILPVHIYGNPCEVKMIGKIAKKHNLAIIYDAAHAFGVKFKGDSILNFGDLSVLSFHATKVFHTVEGGAVVSQNKKTKKRIDWLKNFGITGEVKVKEAGINAKMNEFQSAMGLLQLKYIDENIKKRKAISQQYRNKLKDIPGISLLNNLDAQGYNYSHFPIFIKEKTYGMNRDSLYAKLKKNNIFGRRYFYPLASHFSPYKDLVSFAPDKLVVAERAAKEVICLPIYPGLRKKQVEKIVEVIRN